jgi:hypothetical protein
MYGMYGVKPTQAVRELEKHRFCHSERSEESHGLSKLQLLDSSAKALE